MEVDINIVMDLYKERLANVESDLIISKAQVVSLQNKITKLEELLKENNIDIIQ